MLRWPVVVATACMGSAALAQAPGADPARTLDRVALSIERTLGDADAAVGRAARDLGRVGLEGDEARERLGDLCLELTWALTCTAADPQGVLVSVQPPAYAAYRGREVHGEAHMERLTEAQEPVLSELFRSVEGVDGVSLRHPVFDGDGQLVGSVGVLTRPASLVSHAIGAVLPEAGMLEVSVLQADGATLYDTDAREIGRRILDDPLYEDFPGVREFARRAGASPRGTFEYRFLGRGLNEPVAKRAHWTTVALHGAEWRVAVLETLGTQPGLAAYEIPELPVTAEIGLSALITLADGHITGIAEDFGLIAGQDAVRDGEWEGIQRALRAVDEANVDAVYWYAQPDGSYWTLGEGRVEGGLGDRPYFHRAAQGEAITGELVVSRSTGLHTAIVAVPVTGPDGRVTGVLGASVHLEPLGTRLREELGLPDDVVFYAFDGQDRLALHGDPDKVFQRAGEFGPEIERVFAEMRSRGEGTITYPYEDRRRTLVYRRSPVTGWWYTFGTLGERPPEG